MPKKKKNQKVLLLCLGNICRSPTAEGVLKARAKARGVFGSLTIDSAGTAGYHIGASPDPRTIRAALKRGYDLTPLQARQLTSRDLHQFDEILAMDRSNLRVLQDLAAREPNAPAQIGLFLAYAKNCGTEEVPDPYYGGADGFDQVLDLCEAAADGWLDAHGWCGSTPDDTMEKL